MSAVFPAQWFFGLAVKYNEANNRSFSGREGENLEEKLSVISKSISARGDRIPFLPRQPHALGKKKPIIKRGAHHGFLFLSLQSGIGRE